MKPAGALSGTSRGRIARRALLAVAALAVVLPGAADAAWTSTISGGNVTMSENSASGPTLFSPSACRLRVRPVITLSPPGGDPTTLERTQRLRAPKRR